MPVLSPWRDEIDEAPADMEPRGQRFFDPSLNLSAARYPLRPSVQADENAAAEVDPNEGADSL